MDPQLHHILRQGLISPPEKRAEFRRELDLLPQSEERNYVEASLKDPQATLDDIDQIESGEHYQNWLRHGVKLDESLEISALDGPQNSANLKLVQSNRELVDSLMSREGIDIDEDLRLNVDPVKMMAFARNGEQFYGSIPDQASQKRIQKALELFRLKTSKRTQDKILRAILDAADDILGEEKEFVGADIFIKSVNEKLDSDERLRLAAEFLKIANTSIFNKA